MLDDRNTEPGSHIASVAVWTYDNNYTGWYSLLGDDLGKPSVPPAAAPARLEDFSRLAPGYIEVGTLDIFRDEGIAYAQRMRRAGVSCELHVHPGAPHAYEWINAESALTRRVLADPGPRHHIPVSGRA